MHANQIKKLNRSRRISRLLRGLLLALSCAALLLPAETDPPSSQSSSTCILNHSGPEKTLRGSVADGSGAAVPNVVISISCDDFHRSAATALDGTYSLSVPVGSFRLETQATGFAALSRAIDISDDKRLDLTLSLENVKTTVSVSASSGYLAEDTSAGTKTDVPLIDIPQSISVVARRLLDDQGVVKLDDALKNVAGVMPGGYYDGWDYYRIRGFDASFTTYLDGLRGGNGTSDETYGLQTVEVLKGPSSALYGQGVLGGLVNLTSKRPQPDAFAHVEFSAGSFGFYNPAVDLGGSLNRSHTLYGRVVTLYRTQDSFTDFAYLHRVYVAPSLTWRIARATTLTLLGRYQQEDGRAAYPLPAAGTVLPNINGPIPISRYVGELGDHNNTVHEENKHIGYLFSHSFKDSLIFRQNMRIASYRQLWNNLLYPSFLSEDQRTLYRYPLDYRQKWMNYAVDSSLEASFHTGSVRHTVLAGYDFFRNPQTFTGSSIDFSDPSAYMPLDLFHPVYGQAKYPSSLIPLYGGQSILQYSGIYLQDQVHLTSRLIVTASGRFNFASNRTLPDPSHTDHAFTPRVGVTYLLRSGLSGYASFSRSFLPQSGQLFSVANSNGTSAPPEKGQQWETGVKSSLLGGKLTGTLALFDLQRSNVLTPDVVHPNFNVLTGQQRSQGVEFETAAVLRPGWDFTAAYAYTFARVTEDNSIPLGTPTQNAPRNMVNFWTRYEFQQGWKRGIGLGIGTRYYTAQGGDLLNSFQIPAYGLTDASASYRYGHFRLQLNAYNLGNARYFTGSYDAVYVKPGAPRTIRGTIGWAF